MILDRAKGLLLGAVDQINIRFNPFNKFDRAIEPVDYEPLNVKAKRASLDIEANWRFGPQSEFYWVHDAARQGVPRNDGGDMAIWQGFMLGAQVLRLDENGIEWALEGLAKLQYLGGNSRLLRGADGVDPDNPKIPKDMAYDPSRKYYYEDGYIFHDDCSESTLIGYLFGLWLLLSSNSRNRPVAVRMVNDLARQIMDDGEVMLNQDGSKAKFGHLKPGLLTAPIRISALACLYLMADWSAGGGTEFGKRYAEIRKKYKGALTHPETHFLWVHPWYQDILAYVVLAIQYDINEDGDNKMFWDALMVMWNKTKDEGNSFYAYLLMMINQDWVNAYAIDSAVKTMQEFNLFNTDFSSCKTSTTVTNSEFDSIPKTEWGFGKKKRHVALDPLPVWRRVPTDFAWQRDPYTLDGHSDHRYNYLDYLLAYHMGKHAGLL